MESGVDEHKRALRAWARASPVSDAESRSVVDTLAAWLEGLPPAGVLTYLSMPGEVRAEQVAERAASVGHELYTTRTPGDGPLTIHAFASRRELHSYGFEQPVGGLAPEPPDRIGVVLVPGLCFDRWGGRLGRGRGYYDVLLADLPAARKVGVTLERLVVDRVPTDRHDQPMTDIATERGVLPVSRPEGWDEG